MSSEKPSDTIVPRTTPCDGGASADGGALVEEAACAEEAALADDLLGVRVGAATGAAAPEAAGAGGATGAAAPEAAASAVAGSTSVRELRSGATTRRRKREMRLGVGPFLPHLDPPHR